MRAALTFGPLLVLAGLVLAFGWHISVGAKHVTLTEVFQALTAYDETVFNHIVVRDLRLPRAVLAACVGAALSVAGALMQGVTRNPLTEPGILGLLVGASFAVVMGTAIWAMPAGLIPVVAAFGALAAAAVVWSIAGAAPGGATPLTLVLSGAAVTAMLGALITLAKLLDHETFDHLRVWLSGSLAGRGMGSLWWALPWLIGGLVLGLLLARQVTALAMGEETATGLGVDVARLKALVLLAVVALTAASVALAGPMGFVGLVIPHVVRLLVGADYRLIVPYSAGIGAIYLLVVDIAARLVLAPIEVSTGIVTTMLGAPFFV